MGKGTPRYGPGCSSFKWSKHPWDRLGIERTCEIIGQTEFFGIFYFTLILTSLCFMRNSEGEGYQERIEKTIYLWGNTLFFLSHRLPVSNQLLPVQWVFRSGTEDTKGHTDYKRLQSSSGYGECENEPTISQRQIFMSKLIMNPYRSGYLVYWR